MKKITSLSGFQPGNKYIIIQLELNKVLWRGSSYKCYYMCSCNSHVGRIGGQQFVNMMPWCFPTIHEIMHALGFGHEESRRDRDYYMAFNWTNTNPGKSEKKFYCFVMISRVKYKLWFICLICRLPR